MDTEAIREAVRNAPVQIYGPIGDWWAQELSVVTERFTFNLDLTTLNPGDSIAIEKGAVAEAHAIRESLDRLRTDKWLAQFNGDHWCFYQTDLIEDFHIFLDLDGDPMSPDIDAEEEPEKWCACLVRHFGDRPDVLVHLVNGGADATD